jgi:type I protein arginine methyltransferase
LLTGFARWCGVVQDNDTYYFQSYAHHSIHEVMLRDEVRTGSYARAIADNADSLIAGRTVLDIGCGTGVREHATRFGVRKPHVM